MAHHPGPKNQHQETDLAETILEYSGKAGIAISVLLTLAVLAMTVLPSLAPSGAALAPLVFLALTAGVVAFVRHIHHERGRSL